MTFDLTALAICVAGGLGAAARFVLDGVLRARTPAGYPVGTTVINVTGSFVLGLVAGLAAARLLGPEWLLVLGTGFLGGYTTFSTASFEAARLLEERRPLAGSVHVLGLLIAGTALAAAGLALGAGLAR